MNVSTARRKEKKVSFIKRTEDPTHTMYWPKTEAEREEGGSSWLKSQETKKRKLDEQKRRSDARYGGFVPPQIDYRKLETSLGKKGPSVRKKR